jgi:hypothetical protein
MIDFNNFGNRDLNKVVFYNQDSTTKYQLWQKPKGCRFVHFFVLGPGGGGTRGTVNNGGGGGGSGLIFTSIYPSIFIPDNLYIYVGRGGPGGSATSSAGSGTVTFISSLPSNNQKSTLVGSYGGSSASFSTGGNVGVIQDTYRLIGLQSYGTTSTPISSSYGQAGSNGNLTLPGSNLNQIFPISGGAGGGGQLSGIAYSGGSISGSSYIQTNLGGTSISLNGNDGYTTFNPNTLTNNEIPLIFMGGSGGAGNTLGVGGRGGNGSYGCGGGGGGAGSVNGGDGGRGGDGLVIISWW